MNVALILSGGVGLRLGSGVPKQYIKVNNKEIISYSIERLSEHEDIDAIQIVAEHSWRGLLNECIERYDCNHKFRGFSEPGITRQTSIVSGLKDILNYADADDSVFIHDAARPLLSRALITECFEALENHDGVIPVLPMKDTVYISKDGKCISSLLNRNEVFAGQAPEVFVLGKYYRVNNELGDKILEINGSTEPAVIGNLDVVMIQGDENNYKITTKADLERFREYLNKNINME